MKPDHCAVKTKQQVSVFLPATFKHQPYIDWKQFSIAIEHVSLRARDRV